MISEAHLRELLAQRSERKNLDYKESLNWNTAASDGKCELVKDILALLNTQDGGHIVFGVRNDTFEFVGLSEDDFASFDPTKLNDFLQRYTDPAASCDVQKLSVDGLRSVVITVPEFRDVPIICKRDANSSSDSSKLILKAGGLYIRTDKATSVLVPSAETMRDLMNRALLRRGDQLLGTIEALFRGKPVTNEQTIAKYAEEIESAHTYFDEALPQWGGYWELRAMPEMYSRERIPDISTVWRFVRESEVSLRGWNFPHTDRDTEANFAEGRQSHTVSNRHTEAYRAYGSGLFVWRGGYWEDDPSIKARVEAEYGSAKVLGFVNVIYEITEMFVFLKRYYERFAQDAAIHASIEMTGIKDRQLVTWDVFPPLGTYASQEPRLLIESDYAVPELRASAEELAIKVISRIFEIFNWNAPDPNMIRGWQQRLLSRTL